MFLGHKINSSGFEPDMEKLQSILNFVEPQNATELRTFLGVATYVLSKFVLNFALLVEPLWNVLRSSVFVWTNDANQAFNDVKRACTKQIGLAQYDSKLELTLFCDGGPRGVGSFLSQEGKPIAVHSRLLTDTETRYSQIEKEILAVVYGVKSAKPFLIGRRFTIKTDSSSLIRMFNKRWDDLAPRIQRLFLKLQEFDFAFEHISGENNIVADYLSRNPQPLEQQEIHYPDKHEINLVLTGYPLKSEKIQQATLQDPILCKVIENLEKGWRKSEETRQYFSHRQELTVIEGILWFGRRIVLPETLRNKVLQKAHGGHLGATKMKQSLRVIFFGQD